ncbi:MAG: ATP-grasp domain-containing protein [Methanoregulaceae archaeon]
MKVFLAEYTIQHDPHLAGEGAAMLGVLSGSFQRCGHEVVVPGPGDFGEGIRRLAPTCECGLVIAPDNLLAGFTLALEGCTDNLGCGSMNVAICANKRQTARILSSHGIPVPSEILSGKKVVKPVSGCGADGVRLTEDAPGDNELGQQYIEGENLSVSMIGSRVVGDACENYTGKPPLLLALNRQDVTIDPDGTFHYNGGETPIEHPRKDEIVETAAKAIRVLGCQGYTGIDVVVADKVYVVDVNPRITTSLVGIVPCMEEEIADLLIEASHGRGPESVRLRAHARYGTQGNVELV